MFVSEHDRYALWFDVENNCADVFDNERAASVMARRGGIIVAEGSQEAMDAAKRLLGAVTCAST